MSEDTPTYGTPMPGSEAAADGRLIRTRVQASFLGMILSGRWRAVQTDAPSDLQVVGAEITSFGRTEGWIDLVCSSASFEPVPAGALIPERHFTYVGLPARKAPVAEQEGESGPAREDEPN